MGHTQTCCPGTPVIPAQPGISTRAAGRTEGWTPAPCQGCGRHGPAPAGLAKMELRSAGDATALCPVGPWPPPPGPSPALGLTSSLQAGTPQSLAPPKAWHPGTVGDARGQAEHLSPAHCPTGRGQGVSTLGDGSAGADTHGQGSRHAIA